MLTADTLKATPHKLLKHAQQAVELESAPSGLAETLPPLLMCIANKAMAEVAPDEKPEDAALRLADEWNNRHIKAAYTAILWYYEDYLNPSSLGGNDDPMVRLNMVDVTEDLLDMLKKGNANA